MPRKKIPTKLHVIHGNPGRRPLPADEAHPDIEIPTKPAHITGPAATEWRRITHQLADLGLLTLIDRAALAGYCAAYGRWVEAEDKLKKTGMVIKTTNGNIVQNPLIGVCNRCLEIMHKFLTEFGMTPSSRAKAKTVDRKKPAGGPMPKPRIAVGGKGNQDAD